jgi:hypothetical protein
VKVLVGDTEEKPFFCNRCSSLLSIGGLQLIMLEVMPITYFFFITMLLVIPDIYGKKFSRSKGKNIFK